MRSSGNFLALDVGARRIGVAMADAQARLPAPLTTITREDQIEAILSLIKEHNAVAVVVGLPRGMDGQESAQTKEVRQFVERFKKRSDVPVYLQDESVTSIRAEQELKARSKPYKKEDVDSLSATYILEDFLSQQVMHDKLEGPI